MILHIGPISQFTKFSVESFEGAARGCNIFLATSKKGIGSKKINYPEECRLFDISNKLSILKYFKLIRNADAIIVHGMSIQGAISFIIGKNSIKIWSGWGYDYYGNSKNPDANILSDDTVELIRAVGAKKNKITSYFELFKCLANSYLRNLSAKNTDYFSAPIPQDYFVFKERFKNTSAEYVQLNYGDVTSTFNKISSLKGGNDILVGNSSSATNNHIDIFNSLKKLNIEGRKIVVPLTYGDPDYQEMIIEIGNKFFGNLFFPIINHLPLDDYLRLISNCNIAIMNHHRQQGLGNLGACFYSGMHVYLNDLNPAFDFFKERGAILNSTHDLVKSELPKGLLSASEISRNRAMLDGFWGDNVVRNNTINVLSKIPKIRES